MDKASTDVEQIPVALPMIAGLDPFQTGIGSEPDAAAVFAGVAVEVLPGRRTRKCGGEPDA